MSTSPMGREWDRQFGFFNSEDHRGEDMHHAYLTLLALATSARDLERLHSQLPDNCQLLSDDLRALKNFWRGQCVPKCPDTGTRLLSDDSVGAILATQCQGKSLEGYYADRLLSNRGGSADDAELAPWSRRTLVPSWIKPESMDDDFGAFVGKLYGVTCGMVCSLTLDNLKLLVKLFVMTHTLTASATHRLLSMPKTRWWAYSPGEVPYLVTLDAAPFLDLIGAAPLLPLPEQAAHITKEMLAETGYEARVKEGFTDQLRHSLNSIGMPVDEVGRTRIPREVGWQSSINALNEREKALLSTQ